MNCAPGAIPLMMWLSVYILLLSPWTDWLRATWRHPQNWNNKIYNNATRGGPSHVFRQQVTHFACRFKDMWAVRHADTQTCWLQYAHTMAEVTTTAIQPQPQTMPCRCNQSTSYTSILLRWLTWKSFVSTHFNYYTRHRDTVSIQCI